MRESQECAMVFYQRVTHVLLDLHRTEAPRISERPKGMSTECAKAPKKQGNPNAFFCTIHPLPTKMVSVSPVHIKFCSQNCLSSSDKIEFQRRERERERERTARDSRNRCKASLEQSYHLVHYHEPTFLGLGECETHPGVITSSCDHISKEERVKKRDLHKAKF